MQEKLINRFHIPANMALDILTKMQEESIITEKGAVAKKKGDCLEGEIRCRK